MEGNFGRGTFNIHKNRPLELPDSKQSHKVDQQSWTVAEIHLKSYVIYAGLD